MIYCLLFMAIVLFFIQCPVQGGPPKVTPKSPEIRVGSELDFPPYAFLDKDGKLTGFSIDLIDAVSEAMGLSIKISSGSWDTVWNELAAGRIDVLPIVAKLPERQALVDFSLPHTETFDAFFVPKGKPAIPDLAGAKGKEIVVMHSDAAHHALLERNFQGRLILVDSIPEGLSLVASGKHDALLCSKLIGTMVVKEHKIKGLTAGPPIPDYKRAFSFAVKKGDTELLEKLNQGLLIVKTKGEYNRIYEKWLSVDDPWRKLEKYLWPAIVVGITLALLVGLWLVMLQQQVKRRTRELAEKNELLRVSQMTLRESENRVRFFASQYLKAQEDERRRIAGELHDGVVASLSAVKLKIEKIEDELTRGNCGPEALQEVSLGVNKINGEIRRIMADLRPAILDDLGIVSALKWFCREYEGTNPQISVNKSIGISEKEVPEALKTPIFRISQEAMNNIGKYSRASLINLSLLEEEDKIKLTIQDNGNGFDPNTIRKGLGLSTMRERAELSGGSFDLESAVGKGTVVRAEWKV